MREKREGMGGVDPVAWRRALGMTIEEVAADLDEETIMLTEGVMDLDDEIERLRAENERLDKLVIALNMEADVRKELLDAGARKIERLQKQLEDERLQAQEDIAQAGDMGYDLARTAESEGI